VKPRHLSFGRKVDIPYAREGDKSVTPCPHGGAITGRFSSFMLGTEWAGAMVGSRACDSCEFNKATLYIHVKCSRKPALPQQHDQQSSDNGATQDTTTSP
jgi:hypothetical protein